MKSNLIKTLAFLFILTLGCDKEKATEKEALSSDPLTFKTLDYGGCNLDESTKKDLMEDIDTVIISVNGDEISFFVGINRTCCGEYSACSGQTGDTLNMELTTISEGMCNCICYYTFEFLFGDYQSQNLYYKVFLDERQIFSGQVTE